MRLIVGTALFYWGIQALLSATALRFSIVCVLALIAGLLLLIGLRTSLAGTVLAATEAWKAVAQPGDPWVHVMLATLAAGLAMIGPGAWSIDAYLSGWKRIEVPPRKS
jgi:putative oxidoreductase